MSNLERGMHIFWHQYRNLNSSRRKLLMCMVLKIIFDARMRSYIFEDRDLKASWKGVCPCYGLGKLLSEMKYTLSKFMHRISKETSSTNSELLSCVSVISWCCLPHNVPFSSLCIQCLNKSSENKGAGVLINQCYSSAPQLQLVKPELYQRQWRKISPSLRCHDFTEFAILWNLQC